MLVSRRERGGRKGQVGLQTMGQGRAMGLSVKLFLIGVAACLGSWGRGQCAVIAGQAMDCTGNEFPDRVEGSIQDTPLSRSSEL